MYQFDATITHWINGWSGSSVALDFLMIWISAIGVPLLVFAVAGQWWRRVDRRHVRHVLVASGLSFLLGLAFNQFILLFIHRPRPYDAGVTHLLIARSGDFSFPSDHATATFAIASALLLHGFRRQGRPPGGGIHRCAVPRLHRDLLRQRCHRRRPDRDRGGFVCPIALPGRHARRPFYYGNFVVRGRFVGPRSTQDVHDAAF